MERGHVAQMLQNYLNAPKSEALCDMKQGQVALKIAYMAFDIIGLSVCLHIISAL